MPRRNSINSDFPTRATAQASSAEAQRRGIRIEPAANTTTNNFRGLADNVVNDTNNALKQGAAIRDQAVKSTGNPDGSPNQ